MIYFYILAVEMASLSSLVNCQQEIANYLQEEFNQTVFYGKTLQILGNSSAFILSDIIKGELLVNGNSYNIKGNQVTDYANGGVTYTYSQQAVYHLLDSPDKSRNEIRINFTKKDAKPVERINDTGVVVCVTNFPTAIGNVYFVVMVISSNLQQLQCIEGGIFGTIVTYSPTLIQIVTFQCAGYDISTLKNKIVSIYKKLQLIRTYDCNGCKICYERQNDLLCLDCVTQVEKPLTGQYYQNYAMELNRLRYPILIYQSQKGKPTQSQIDSLFEQYGGVRANKCNKTKTPIQNCSAECQMCRQGWCSLCQNKSNLFLNVSDGNCTSANFTMIQGAISFQTGRQVNKSQLLASLMTGCLLIQFSKSNHIQETRITNNIPTLVIPESLNKSVPMVIVCNLEDEFYLGYLDQTLMYQQQLVQNDSNESISEQLQVSNTLTQTNSSSSNSSNGSSITFLNQTNVAITQPTQISLGSSENETDPFTTSTSILDSFTSSTMNETQSLGTEYSTSSTSATDLTFSKQTNGPTENSPGSSEIETYPSITSITSTSEPLAQFASTGTGNETQSQHTQILTSSVLATFHTNLTISEREIKNAKILDLYQHNLLIRESDAQLIIKINSTYVRLVNENSTIGKIAQLFRLFNFWTIFTNVPYWLSYQQLLPWPQIYHLQQIEKVFTLWVFTGSYLTLFPSKSEKPTLIFMEFPNIEIQDEDMAINLRSLGFSSYFIFSNLTSIISILLMLVLTLIVRLVSKKPSYILLDKNNHLQQLIQSQALSIVYKIFIQEVFEKEFQPAKRFVDTLFLKVLDKSFYLSIINMVVMHQYPPFHMDSDGIAYISFIIAYLFWILYLYKQYMLLKEISRAIAAQNIIKTSHQRQLEEYNAKLRMAYAFSLGDLNLQDTYNGYYHFFSLLKKLFMALVITLGPSSSYSRESLLLIIATLQTGFLLNQRPYLLKIKFIFFVVINMVMVAILLTKCFTQHQLTMYLNYYSTEEDRLHEIIRIGWVIISFELFAVGLSIIYSIIYYILQLILCIQKRKSGRSN